MNEEIREQVSKAIDNAKNMAEHELRILYENMKFYSDPVRKKEFIGKKYEEMSKFQDSEAGHAYINDGCPIYSEEILLDMLCGFYENMANRLKVLFSLEAVYKDASTFLKRYFFVTKIREAKERLDDNKFKIEKGDLKLFKDNKRVVVYLLNDVEPIAGKRNDNKVLANHFIALKELDLLDNRITQKSFLEVVFRMLGKEISKRSGKEGSFGRQLTNLAGDAERRNEIERIKKDYEKMKRT